MEKYPFLSIIMIKGMTMKKQYIILLSIICGICLSGCTNNSSTSNQQKSKLSVSPKEAFPKHVKQKLSSGIEVDADVSLPQNHGETISIYDAIAMPLDVEKIADTLMNEAFLVQTEDAQSKGNEIIQIYSDKNNSELLSINDTWVTFSTNDFSHIRTDFNEETLSEHKIFEFATPEEADKTIRDMLNHWNINVYPEYECVAIDYETLKEKNLEQYNDLDELQEIQEERLILNHIPWSEKYDCYYFTYYASIDGYKVSSMDREVNNTVIPGTAIKVVYSKEGIQSFEISNIYTKQTLLETNVLCTVSEALEKIDQKYNSIILQGIYQLKSIELEYFADSLPGNKKYKMIPVWKCTVNHIYDTKDKISEKIIGTEEETTVLINAITGAEVYSGGNR